MKRLGWLFREVVASPAVTPAVIGFFALIYIIVAFYSDEALVTLLALTRNNIPLSLLLACIPVNIAARLIQETGLFIRRRRSVDLQSVRPVLGADEERVELPGKAKMELIEKELGQAGYHYRQGSSFFAAWKGISIFPARVLFLLGLLMLFSGLLLSTTTRTSIRVPIIEGEPLPEAVGVEGRIDQILFQEDRGLFMARSLDIIVALGGGGSTESKKFSLYPPGSVNGIYLYPRYLGLAPFVEFTPAEPAFAFSSYVTLMIYPPGKEDSVEVPGSPYKIVFSLVEPGTGQDPYISGKYELHFRVLKLMVPVAEGTLNMGASVRQNGSTLAFPNAKRIVVTDLVRDRGTADDLGCRNPAPGRACCLSPHKIACSTA